MRVFIFYSAHLEIEKDIQERDKLLEQLQTVDKRLNVRNGLLIGMLKGIIETGKGQNASVQTNLLISGGTEVKYQGITIHKHTTCNTWYARYRFGGKQHYISARTQQLCYDKLKKVLLKTKQKEQNKTIVYETKTKEKPSAPPSITFIDWYRKWLNLYKKDVKLTTIDDYKSSLSYTKDIFNTPINQITSIQILGILNAIVYERRRQKVYELLKDIFSKAHLNDIIEKNPILVIEKPKHKKVNGQALTNTDEQLMEKLFIENQMDLYLVCLYQGLRRGEALALTMEDVDFNAKTLRINKSINNRNMLDTTKNIYSNRIMPLFDKTIKVFQKYKNAPGYIFASKYYAWELLFEKIRKEHFSNKKYTTHSLRHTFITRCQEMNIPLHIIQKWVGHVTGSSVTSSVYTHIRNDAEVDNINLYNEKLNSN